MGPKTCMKLRKREIDSKEIIIENSNSSSVNSLWNAGLQAKRNILGKSL